MDQKKFKLKLKNRGENKPSPSPPQSQKLRLKRDKLKLKKPVLEPELEELAQAFEVFKEKAALTGNITPERRIELINKLLSHFQTINEIVQVINQGTQRDIIGNFANTISTQEKHNTYEISNDITLLNFGETRLANVIEMFSDPDFITHIVRKDDFKNKYSVIVYDKKWDNTQGERLRNLGEK